MPTALNAKTLSMGLVLVCALACGPAAIAASGCPHDKAAVHSLPVGPMQPGILVRSTSFHREGASGFRVFEDGRFERRVHDGPWVLQRTLTALQVRSIAALIQQSQLEEATGVHGDRTPVSDASRHVVEVASPKRASLFIATEDGCPVPALQTFLGALHLLLVPESL